MSTPKTNKAASASPRDEVRRLWVVMRMGVLGLYRSQIPRMAAALAYRTIFSIIPVMAIGLLIFGSVVSDAQVEAGVRRVLTFAGISQISAVEQKQVQEEQVKESEEGEEGEDEYTQTEHAGHDPEQVLSDSIDSINSGEPGDLTLPLVENRTPVADEQTPQTLSQSDIFANADLEKVITDLITRVNNSIRNVPTGWIALTSGLVLFYAAMSMLIEIEKAFNQLCGAPSGRGWLRRLMLYWTILTAGSLLLAATFLAGDAFTNWVVGIAGQDSIFGAMMAGYGVSVLISTLLLLGAYLTIPNTKVQFRSALAGAFFAAVGWGLGKLGFTTYLRYSTGYAKFYGSIAILPLFMMWVYLTWVIVLFGMQAAFALQHFSRLVESKLELLSGVVRPTPVVIDPMIMFNIAKAVQESFQAGKPCTSETIANITNLDAAQATQMLEALTEGGVLNRVQQGEERIGWALARPAQEIDLDEILKAAYQIDGYRAAGIEDQLPSKIRQAMSKACSNMTLADLADSTMKQAKSDGETRSSTV